jgi:transmembrane sensor
MASDYTIEKLLLDENFIEFCLHPESSNSRKWEQLIENKAIDRDTLAEARSILNLLTPGLSASEIGEEVMKLKGIIEIKTEKGSANSVETGNERPGKRRLTRMLAYGSVLAAVAITIYFSLRPGNPNTPVMVAKFETKTGEQKKIILPDGTSVILNSNTSISYDKGYNGSERIVHLSGKAFFRVTKNPGKPFSVYSTNYSTTALGTSFYVSADSSEEYSVRLLEGKLKLSAFSGHQTAFLNAGEEALWQKGQKNFLKHHFDSTYLNQWLTGKIVFLKTPAHEVFEILQQWYGVEIIDNRKEKTNMAINGTYENVSLEDILKVTCFTLNCQITYQNNKIIIQ